MKKFAVSCLFSIAALFAFSQNSCPPNIGFEQGNFTNWQCYIGTVALVSNPSPANVITVVPSNPIPGRFAILPATNLSDPFGGFPYTPDGNPIARLGFVGQIGAQVERISYTFTVPSNVTEYSLTFKTAMVYQEPYHSPLESRPHFEAKLYDSTTQQYINCASGEIFPIGTSNGFQLSPVSSGGGQVYYRPWAAATLILNDYIGHVLRLEFTNADCTATGHWAYCYVDVEPGCGGPIPNKICPGTSATITGPWGYQSYNWWNSNFTQSLGTSQFLTLTPPPSTPTVYAVDLVPITGAACRDTVFVTVNPQPNVIGNAGPDAVFCGTSTTVGLGTAPIAGYKYKWTPSAGLNDSLVAQPIAQPPVTTSYILTVTDTTTGCTLKDTVTVFVNTLPPPFISIAGNLLTSSATSGNQWYLNGNPVSGATGQTHTATAPGNYTVIVTSNGCSSMVSNSINYNVTAIDPVAAAWNLQIVPNPAKDKLVISYNGNQHLDLEVLDLTGRRVFASKGISSTYTVDLSKFQGGAYLVRLINSKTRKEAKQLIIKID